MSETIDDLVKTAHFVERQRILDIIHDASYRYDSPIVNRFIADLISIIVEAKE